MHTFLQNYGKIATQLLTWALLALDLHLKLEHTSINLESNECSEIEC